MQSRWEEDVYETDVDTGQRAKVEAGVSRVDPLHSRLRKPTETAERKEDHIRAVSHNLYTTNNPGQKLQKVTEQLRSLALNKTSGSSVEPLRKNESEDDNNRVDDSNRVDDNNRVDDTATGTGSKDDTTASQDKENSKEELLERGAVREKRRAHRKEPYVTSASSPPSARDSTYHDGAYTPIPTLQNKAIQSPRRVHPSPDTSQMGTAQTERQETSTPQKITSHFQNSTVLPHTTALDSPSFSENCVVQPSQTVGSDVDALPLATPSMQEFIYNELAEFDGSTDMYSKYVARDNINTLAGRGEDATDSKEQTATRVQVRQLSIPTTDDQLQSTAPNATLPVMSNASTSTAVLEEDSRNVPAHYNIPTVVPPDVDAIFAVDGADKNKRKKKRGKSNCKNSAPKKPQTSHVFPNNTVHDVANAHVTPSNDERFQDALTMIKSDMSEALTDPSLDNANPNLNYTDTSLINPTTKSRAQILPDQVHVTPIKPVGVVQSTQARASRPQTACNHPTNTDTTIPQNVVQTTMSNNGQTPLAGVISPLVSTPIHGGILNHTQSHDMPMYIGPPTCQAQIFVVPPNLAQLQLASNMLQTIQVAPVNQQPSTFYQLVGNQLIQLPTNPANAQQMTVGSVAISPYQYQQEPSSIAAFQPIATVQVLPSTSVVSSSVPGSSAVENSGVACCNKRDVASVGPSQNPRQKHDDLPITGGQKTCIYIRPKRTD